MSEAADVLRRLAFESRVGDVNSKCRVIQLVGEAASKDGACARELLEGDAAASMQMLTTAGTVTHEIQIAVVDSLSAFPAQDECRSYLDKNEQVRAFVIELAGKAVDDLVALQEHVLDMLLAYSMIDIYVTEMLKNNILDLIVRYTVHPPNQPKCGMLLEKIIEVASATEIREACDTAVFLAMLQCAASPIEAMHSGVAETALTLSRASREVRGLKMSSGAFMALICLTQVPDTVERGNSTSSQAEEALANFSDSVALLSPDLIEELAKNLFQMYIPRCLEQFETNAVQLNFANRILENLFSEASSLPFLVNKTCMRPILRCLECTDSTTVILAIQGLDHISEIDRGVNMIVMTGIETIISSISREEDIQGPAIRVFKRILLERPDALEKHVKRSEDHIRPTVLALIAIAIRDASVDLTTNKGLQILLTHWNHEISDEAEFATVLENQATFVAQGEYIVTQAPGLLADLLRSENDDVNSIIARVSHFASDTGLAKLFSKVDFELLCKMATHLDDNVLWLMAKLVAEGCSKGPWIDALDMKLLLDAIQQVLTQTRHSETWIRLAQAMRLIIARTGVLTWVTEHFSMFLQITDQLVQHAEPNVVIPTAIYMKVCAEQSTETFNTKPQDLTKTAMKILGGHPQVKVKTAFCEILLMLVQHEEIQSHLVERSMIQPLTKIFKIDN